MTESIVWQGQAFSVVHRPCKWERAVYCGDILIGYVSHGMMIRATALNGHHCPFDPVRRSWADVLGWLMKEFEKVEVVA